ncbi:PstS family phosphate ABC transporter substrate-binding protein [Pontibacter harenae]|uniref:PstS family phosphate ABC transporter substrate-binding protein n=1 Tax=Pontibacter harenae TaxID=2894083 RepID=UPI001E400B4F|nr:substrate-binding domain-containing protein [Pontibacter harenae]MCC9168660.1 substrate-binding domain-containing protein [Pontibacter harenae]
MADFKVQTVLATLASAILLSSCGNSTNTPANTPTSGEVTISVDESFQPIVESQVKTFEGIYKYAEITDNYKPEGAVIQDLLNDSVKVAVLSRDLNESERTVFEKQNRIPRSTKLAIDAVALVVNNNNPDSLLTLDQVKSIFSGNTTSWKNSNSSSNLQDITIVFDNNSSSTARFVKDSLLAGQDLPKNTYASNSHTSLIDYVAENNNAIGVIGVNWISDTDDTTSVGFRNKVKVVGISKEANPESVESYYQPYQAYIAEGTYPLTRNLYIINIEGRAGLGTGFASFAAGDQGQRIILKSGLVPATMPVRIIGLRK